MTGFKDNHVAWDQKQKEKATLVVNTHQALVEVKRLTLPTFIHSTRKARGGLSALHV